MSIVHLFPTPVYKFSLTKHEVYKERLVNRLKQIFKDEPNRPAEWAVNCYSWQIEAHELDIDIRDLYDEIMSNLMKYVDYLQIGKDSYFQIFESWFNVHRHDMYQEEHGHMPSFVSGIYYLQFDKQKDQPVTFLSPDKTFLYSASTQNLPITNPQLSAKYQLDIDEGDVILFPSTLHHMVLKSKSHDQLRITNSFNIAPAPSVHP